MAELIMNDLPTRKQKLPLVLSIANVIIKELRLVELVNETVEWDRTHWNISPGGLAKMLVLSTFTDVRVPLTHLEDRLANINVEYFLSASDKSSYVNAFNVGEALDRIGEKDYDGIYERIALTAVRLYDMPVKRLHNDTTTISFYGEYDLNRYELTESEREELLQIERGYNKDGRPQENQVVVGQVVNEYGIPLISRTLNGSTSDIDWNGEAIKYAAQIWSSGFEKGIFVADCKLVTAEHVTAMNAPESKISFVSRCPANFGCKLEQRMISKAYESGEWQCYAPIGTAKDATTYKGVSLTEEVCGAPMRLLVLESSSLRQKAAETFTKKEAELQPLIKALEKRQWACLADAEKESAHFLRLKELSLFDCCINIEKRVVEKWPKGRRGVNTKPKYEETFHIHVEKISRREPAYQDFIHRESCIVLISNAEDSVSDEDLLKTYKGQQVVENSFRMLKSPPLASVIYLKKPKRIQVLTMLLTFSLLLRALIQYRLREGLKKFKEEHPDQKIYAGWGGRPLENPTFKLLYEHSVNCCFERETCYQYSFAWPNVETKERVAPLLMLLGLSLEQLVK